MITQTFSEIWSRISSGSNRPKLQRSLSEAAEAGDSRSVDYWIKEKGSNPCEVDSYGYFPLLNATLNNRLSIVMELVSVGADLNQKGAHGYTALHAAAQNNYMEVAEYLIKAGADLNPRNEDTDTPLLLATRAQHLEMIALLSKAGGDATIKGFRKESSIEMARKDSLIGVAESLEKLSASRLSFDDNELTASSMGAHLIPHLGPIPESNE